jgi:hypothetical protein
MADPVDDADVDVDGLTPSTIDIDYTSSANRKEGTAHHQPENERKQRNTPVLYRGPRVRTSGCGSEKHGANSG